MREPNIIAGALIGAMLAFVFCSTLLRAVSKGAFKMVEEVRRQFREIKGILEGRARPDYESCIAISTKASLEGLILPGILSVIVPVIVGFVLKKKHSLGFYWEMSPQAFPLLSSLSTVEQHGITLKNSLKLDILEVREQKLTLPPLSAILLEIPLRIRLALLLT